jgi:hypothetical protein
VDEALLMQVCHRGEYLRKVVLCNFLLLHDQVHVLVNPLHDAEEVAEGTVFFDVADVIIKFNGLEVLDNARVAQFLQH